MNSVSDSSSDSSVVMNIEDLSSNPVAVRTMNPKSGVFTESEVPLNVRMDPNVSSYCPNDLGIIKRKQVAISRVQKMREVNNEYLSRVGSPQSIVP